MVCHVAVRGSSTNAHQNALTCRPGPFDGVSLHLAQQLVIDPVGGPCDIVQSRFFIAKPHKNLPCSLNQLFANFVFS